MGYYLNNDDTYHKYQEVVNGRYFIDKSPILTEIIPLIGTSQKYICITRPRRFGKTTMANMIGAFFQKPAIHQIFLTLCLFQIILIIRYT